MKAIKLIIIAVLAVLAGCSPKVVEHVRVEYRDSVRVDIRERIVHDTLRIRIPVESEKVATPDTSSHLENSVACSDAYVSGGILHHSLWNKPVDIDVPVAIPVTDTSIVHDSVSMNDSEKEKTVYVDRHLSWWQRFRLGSFPWLLLIILILGAWTFRKPLLSLIRL